MKRSLGTFPAVVPADAGLRTARPRREDARRTAVAGGLPARLPRLTAVVLVLAAGAARAQDPAPVFTPAAGFAGASEGRGTLRLFLGPSRAVHVRSHGRWEPDSTFRLDQSVRIGADSARSRTWYIRTVAPGRYEGTLCDAPGRVTGRTDGARLRLRYRVAGPLVMRQTLDLQPDGRTIVNRGTITLLGVPVGRLRETITRLE